LASFRKHPNGTWEYRIRYKDRSTGKYKEKSKRGFKTKKKLNWQPPRRKWNWSITDSLKMGTKE
jgi:hypothetical protein